MSETIKPIFIDHALSRDKILYQIFVVPTVAQLCFCISPTCPCGCNYDILSFPKCVCNPAERKCINCDKKLAFCHNGLLLRCFYSSDISNNIRFTEKCSCEGVECLLGQYKLFTKKEYYIGNGNYKLVLYENKIFYADSFDKLIPSVSLEKVVVQNFPKYLDLLYCYWNSHF